MGDVWDDQSGTWVPESAPWVPAPSPGQGPVSPEPVSDPLLDLINEHERARGGFYVGRDNHSDEAFLKRVRDGEDRSDDGQARTRHALLALRAALVTFRDCPDGASADDYAHALAYRVEMLLDEMGIS